MNSMLLDIIACPKCGKELEFEDKQNRLYCSTDNFLFKIEKGIPVLLENEAILNNSNDFQENK
ncbi:hypothetical protein RCS94_06015 [Orbaceae bacterium ac157xtp]